MHYGAFSSETLKPGLYLPPLKYSVLMQMHLLDEGINLPQGLDEDEKYSYELMLSNRYDQGISVGVRKFFSYERIFERNVIIPTSFANYKDDSRSGIGFIGLPRFIVNGIKKKLHG